MFLLSVCCVSMYGGLIKKRIAIGRTITSGFGYGRK